MFKTLPPHTHITASHLEEEDGVSCVHVLHRRGSNLLTLNVNRTQVFAVVF